MPRVTKVTYIDADPNKVIDYIANVPNHPAFISALKSVDNLSGDPKEAGTTWDWTFMMGGVELKGDAEATGYEEGKKYSYKTKGGIESTFTYSVEPSEGEGNKLTIDVDYEVPDTVLGKVANQAVVERLNDQEGDRAAENLKAILES